MKAFIKSMTPLARSMVSLPDRLELAPRVQQLESAAAAATPVLDARAEILTVLIGLEG
jgi:hypothetical protein